MSDEALCKFTYFHFVNDSLDIDMQKDMTYRRWLVISLNLSPDGIRQFL